MTPSTPKVLGPLLAAVLLAAPAAAEVQADVDPLQAAQAWLDQGRPGRALIALDAAEGPADAAHLQLEWQAASAARDYERLLDSARRVVDQPVKGLSAPLAPFWAAHAALWLRRTSAASSALLALESSLEPLEEAERAPWLDTLEQYRDQVAEAQAAQDRTRAAVGAARRASLAILAASLLGLLLALRR